MTPIIWLTFSFALGIIVQKVCMMPLFLLLTIVLCVFILICLAFNDTRSFQWLMFCAVFLLGMLLLSLKQLPPSRCDISNHAFGRDVSVIGVIDGAPSINKGFYTFFLKAEAVDRQKTCGKVLCCVSAEGLSSLKYGDRVRIKGELSHFDKRKNPGLSTYFGRLEDQVVRAELFSPASPPEIISRGNGNFIRAACYWLTARFNEVCSKLLPPPYSDLLGSIVLGASASPPPDYMKDAYRRVGIIHLLVASGQQISILFGFILASARLLKFPKRSSAMIASSMGVIFSLVAGAGPSIIRALIMSETALLAELLGRESEPSSALSLSAFIILIFDPRLLFDIGFQLSFAATFSLLCVAPILEEALCGKVPGWIAAVLSVSVAPFLLTMPVILYNFSQLSVVSVFVNSLVIFWVEILVLIGFIALFAGFLFAPLCFVFSGPLFLLLKLLNFIVFTFNGLPFSSVYIVSPSFSVLLCYYVCLLMALYKMKKKQQIKVDAGRILVVAVFLLAAFAWHFASASPQELSGNILRVTVIDVGQGDSILIQAPSGKNVLIDGGVAFAGKGVVVPLLQKKGINKLDMVVLSHPHEDHVGGLPFVLNAFKVDMVLDSAQPHTASTYIKFLKMIKSLNIKYKAGRAGDSFDLGEGVKAYILWPKNTFITGTNSDLNNNSIVIRLVYGKFSILLPGDLGFEGEKGLMATGPYLKSDVLKAGHHGSSTSTSGEFLEKVKPRVAIISVSAANRYGHPSRRTLDRLSSFGVKVYRTDKNGAVEIDTDGVSYVVKPYVK